MTVWHPISRKTGQSPHRESSRTRNKIQRLGAECLVCGSTEDLTIDHIIPKSKGGKGRKNNKQVLCRTCNLFKGRKLPIVRYE